MLSRIARAAFVTTKPSILYSGLLSAHRRSLTTEGNESSSKTTNPVGGWIKSDLENIHTDIRGLFATDKPELLEIARYYFDGSGKSIRPLLICSMARLVNRQLDEANGRLDARQRQIALIAEMIHVSSLIHDDIIDHSELRRGRASVNARWGAPKAVLAGDYILAVAARALAQLGDAQVVETLSRVLEDLVKGELMQFGTKEDENERFEHYTTKTYRKTASLIANSCKAVAILAQAQLPSECLATSSSSSAAEHKRFPHDAPERDFVNFPAPSVPTEAGKVRIGLVPDDWFKAMYDKTGVTGPYILFWGGLATLLSKEYFVYWADTTEQLVFLGLVIFASKKYGHKLGAWLDKEADAANSAITKGLADQTKAINEKIVQSEALQSLPEANTLIHAAKKENIQLQLEAAFRQRLHQLYQEVKRRLDYQLAIQSVYKRLEKEQAVNYILNQVNSSIGATQEKEAFQLGLNQLKSLSQKYAGTI